MKSKDKVKSVFKIIKHLISNPRSIFLVLKDESLYEKYILKKYTSTQFPTTDIAQFFVEGKSHIEKYTFLDGTSLIPDLALLKSLSTSINNCEYLEIGTWRGESIVNVASCAKHCTSINLSPEEIITRGFPEKYAKLHGCLITKEQNITQIHADSREFDFNSLHKKFDLIFIDGDHSYEGVKSDTEKVFNLLRNDDSMIVWHDYGFNPEMPRYSVIAGILDGLPRSEHPNLYHVSNSLCAIYSKKKLNAFIQQYPVYPEKTFKIILETN
jgi:predicted O-methyltransferase YrrM